MTAIFRNFTFFSILSFFVFTACNKTESPQDEVSSRTEVEICYPTIRSISEFQKFNAVTQFQKKESLRAPSTGYISKLNFRIGEKINTGDLIGSLSTKEQEAIKKLNSKDSVFNSFQKPIHIKSGSTGVLTSLLVSEGSYVSEGDVIGVISDPASLVALLNVPFESHQLFSIGKSCKITLPDGNQFSAQISKIIPAVDQITQSQTFILDLSKHLLPENLNIMVRVNSKLHEHSLCVETKAVQTNELQTSFWVMKVVGDSLAIKTEVTTGIQSDSLTEIIFGNLTISDKIISVGAFELPDSALVKIRN